jgi:hypothetical protein
MDQEGGIISVLVTHEALRYFSTRKLDFNKIVAKNIRLSFCFYESQVAPVPSLAK